MLEVGAVSFAGVGSFSVGGSEDSEDKSEDAAGEARGFCGADNASGLSSLTLMFSEYRILRESRFGLETVMLSAVSLWLWLWLRLRPSLGGRTFSFNLGFLDGGSIDIDSREGDGVGCTLPEVGVGARALPDPEAMPRSVASLYFLIFALDIREVK